MRSRGKLNTLYLHLQETYEHQARQPVDFLRQAPTLGKAVTSGKTFTMQTLRPCSVGFLFSEYN